MKYAEQARTLVAMRAARERTKIARDWRAAMISVISESRATGSSPGIALDPVEPVEDTMIEEVIPAKQRRDWRVAMIEMIRGVAVMGIVALAACSSLVDDPCADGYMLSGDHCVERLAPDSGDIDRPMPDGPLEPDGPAVTPDSLVTPDSPVTPDAVTPDGPITPDVPVTPDAPVSTDAGVDATTDAPLTPDAPVCAAPSKVCDGTCTDVTSDPQDCGTCGHVCASGICTAGVCAGELAGHIVAIGHDYQQHNIAMARVLGNAAALASASDLGIAHVRGTATTASRVGTNAALTSSLAAIGRTHHAVVLPAVGSPLTGIDVLVIDAQTGDGAIAEALGAQWKSAIDELLARHGVVVVVEGVSGVSHRFAAGAGLFSVGTPVDTTGSPAFVAAAGDAVVQQVPSPYLADTTSVVFPSVVGAIVTPSGTVVMHLTR